MDGTAQATLAASMQSLAVGDSPGPGLRQRKSQRFTVPTLPLNQAVTPPVPPMPQQSLPSPYSQDGRPPSVPRDVDSLGSSDSSTSNPFSMPHPGFPGAHMHGYASPPSTAPSSYSPRSRAGTNQSQAQAQATWSRATLPPSWLADPEYAPAPQQPHYLPPGPSPGSYAINGFGLPGQETEDDEVIPTAIVIKNIPFSIRRETMLALMEDLHIPPPHAMNYHVDNGQFRGLAFANFRHPFEADAALAALNGYDLQGRRLRVEYKRVLRAGEKERIERDKAMKRMRSAVSFGGPQVMPPPGPHRQQSSGYLHEDYEDYGTPIPSTLGLPHHNHYASPPPVPAMPQYIPVAPQPQPPPPQHPASAGFHAVSMGMIGSPPSESGISSGTSASIERSPSAPLPDRPAQPPTPGATARAELDMNDAQTLEIYSRVLLFKEDSLRDELAFARSLSATQRRVVHLVAQKLSLDHASVGEGEHRHVVVYKPGARPASMPAPTDRHVPRSASRGDLRSKRSAPDLRSRRSTANVRATQASGVPNVPSLPNLDSAALATRQPRGPDTGANGLSWRARPTPPPALESPSSRSSSFDNP